MKRSGVKEREGGIGKEEKGELKIDERREKEREVERKDVRREVQE